MATLCLLQVETRCSQQAPASLLLLHCPATGLRGNGRVPLESRLSQNSMCPRMAWNSLQYSCLSFLSGSTMPIPFRLRAASV